jgi:hypothetical protein
MGLQALRSPIIVVPEIIPMVFQDRPASFRVEGFDICLRALSTETRRFFSTALFQPLGLGHASDLVGATTGVGRGALLTFIAFYRPHVREQLSHRRV